MAYEAIIHATKILRAISAWEDSHLNVSQIWDSGIPWSKRAAIMSNDLGFLKRQLQKVETDVKGMQQLLRERLELSHNRRGFILTLIAAVYLPLSFATSFFGMNINTATPPTESGFSNYTSNWISNSPADFQNTTRAIVSTIGTSGTLTYSWEIFGITAGGLLLTLPLSLTLGSIVRSLYRSVRRYARHWRIVTVPGVAATFFFSVAGPNSFASSHHLYVVSNVLLVTYAWFATVSAWWKFSTGDSEANPFYWIFMFPLVLVCFSIGVRANDTVYYGLTFIPWVIIFSRWLVPLLKRLGAWPKA